MTEADADITLLAKNPDHLKQLRWNDANQFIKTFEGFKRDPDVMAEGSFGEHLERQLEIAKQVKVDMGKSKQSIKEKFKLADQEDIYNTTYAFLCSSTHNNLADLTSRHIRSGQLVVFDKMKPGFMHSASGQALAILISVMQKLPLFTSLSAEVAKAALEKANLDHVSAQERYLKRIQDSE